MYQRNGSYSYTNVSVDFGDMSAEHYPALAFAYNYAGTEGTHVPYNGYYYRNWYIPSIAEVYQVYLNKTTVEESLTKIFGTSTSISTLMVSSSQKETDSTGLWALYTDTGTPYDYGIFNSGNGGYFWPIHEF